MKLAKVFSTNSSHTATPLFKYGVNDYGVCPAPITFSFLYLNASSGASHANDIHNKLDLKWRTEGQTHHPPNHPAHLRTAARSRPTNPDQASFPDWPAEFHHYSVTSSLPSSGHPLRNHLDKPPLRIHLNKHTQIPPLTIVLQVSRMTVPSTHTPLVRCDPQLVPARSGQSELDRQSTPSELHANELRPSAREPPASRGRREGGSGRRTSGKW